MTTQQDVYKSVQAAIVELFTLDCTIIGQGVLRFCGQTNANGQAVVFNGNSYTALPISGSGWSKQTSGSAPRPVITISNVNHVVQSLVYSAGNIAGSTLTRQRVYSTYLDAVNFSRYNLLNYSQSALTTTAGWQKVSTIASDNVYTAPDGTSTASRVRETAVTPASPYFYITQTVAVGAPNTYTFSTYLKAAERTFANLRFDDTAGVNTCAVGINLTTGVPGAVATAGTVTNASVVVADAGNGWYRVSLTATWASITSVRVFVRPAIGTGQTTDLGYLGDVTKGIAVWGMQLEAGSSSTTYQWTTTTQQSTTADPSAILSNDVYVVNRVISIDKVSAQFELCWQIDRPGVRLPRRVALRDQGFPGLGLNAP